MCLDSERVWEVCHGNRKEIFFSGGKDETGREKMVSGFFCFSFQSFTVAFSDHFISLSVVCVCCFDVK